MALASARVGKPSPKADGELDTLLAARLKGTPTEVVFAKRPFLVFWGYFSGIFGAFWGYYLGGPESWAGGIFSVFLVETPGSAISGLSSRWGHSKP